MSVVHHYHTPNEITLRREINRQPELCQLICELEATEWNDILSAVATYLDIDVDGAFLPEEINSMNADFAALLRKHREEKANEQQDSQ